MRKQVYLLLLFFVVMLTMTSNVEAIVNLAGVNYKNKQYYFERHFPNGGTIESYFVPSIKQLKEYRTINTNKKLKNVYGGYSGEKSILGEALATCIYHGKIYVFFDDYNNNYRNIYVRYTTDPEEKASNPWKPVGDGTIESIFRSQARVQLAVAVLNDNMYLFCSSQDNNITAFKYNDAEGWKKLGSYKMKFLSIDCRTIMTETKEQVIFLAGCADNKLKTLIFKFINTEEWEEGPTHELSYINQNYLKMEYGSMFCNGSSPKNVVQITTPYMGKCRIIEYEIKGPYGDKGVFGKWRDLEFQKEKVEIYSDGAYCLVSRFLQLPKLPAFAGDKNPIQQRISLFSYKATVTELKKNNFKVQEYASDIFGNFTRGHILPTANPKYKSAWTLVGIIQGVPPFSYNNAKPSPTIPLSTVSYGETYALSVTTTSESSVSFLFGMSGTKFNISLGMSYELGLSSILSLDCTRTRSTHINFSNLGSNLNGYRGKIIYLYPKLLGWECKRYPYAGDKLFDINFVETIDIDLGHCDYDLTDPWSGMEKRPISSNFKAWNLSPPDSKNEFGNVNDLTATSSTTQGIEICSSRKEDITHTISNQISVEFSLLFMNLRNTHTFTKSTKYSTSISKNIGAFLKLPMPLSETTPEYESITIQPFWLVPNNVKTAEWIPDSHSNNRPWCLTWRLVSYTPWGSNTIFINPEEKRE